MRAVVLLSSIALVLAAGAQATPPRGTLTGLVTRGPITPVCAAEQPCSEPARHLTLLFVRRDGAVARAVTNDAGRYRLRLVAGTYTVRRMTNSGPIDRKLEPNHARVRGGRTTTLDFSIDTGIRLIPHRRFYIS